MMTNAVYQKQGDGYYWPQQSAQPEAAAPHLADLQLRRHVAAMHILLLMSRPGDHNASQLRVWHLYRGLAGLHLAPYLYACGHTL
jgi:hypothetical protein